MQIKDRIKELRRVKAGDLIPNPKNWRTHPQYQQDALKGVLAEVGFADALLVRETDDGLMLVDGHLRAETTPDSDVPVLILDLDEAEADLVLATLDPLAAMARSNQDQLSELLQTVNVSNDAVNVMLDALINGETEPLLPPGDTPSLDDLEEQYGSLDEEALWPVITIRVPPELKVRFDDWLASGTGKTEVERLADLLGIE
jgi:hypothetical protein